jgi:hypothetical protein
VAVEEEAARSPPRPPSGGGDVVDPGGCSEAAPGPSKRQQLPLSAAPLKQQQDCSPQQGVPPPLSASGPASSRDKLRYAAVMCVGKWAAATAFVREGTAQVAEAGAEAALKAARAQAEGMLVSLGAGAHQAIAT